MPLKAMDRECRALYVNSLKQKMKNHELITGCMIPAALPALVEISALAGFDFVFLDAEQGPLSEKDCEALILAAEARGIVPLVRVPQNAPEVVLRYMDVGAMGIIMPGVRNRGEAERVVRSVKYSPRGERGLTLSRAFDYGMRGPMGEYVAEANRQTVVLAIIESREAVENIREILSVEGLDGVIMGAGDLSQDLGFPGQTAHPEVEAAFQKALDLGLPSGKSFGSVLRAGETPDKYLNRGVNILLTGAFPLLVKGAREFVSSVKG